MNMFTSLACLLGDVEYTGLEYGVVMDNATIGPVGWWAEVVKAEIEIELKVEIKIKVDAKVKVDTEIKMDTGIKVLVKVKMGIEMEKKKETESTKRKPSRKRVECHRSIDSSAGPRHRPRRCFGGPLHDCQVCPV